MGNALGYAERIHLEYAYLGTTRRCYRAIGMWRQWDKLTLLLLNWGAIWERIGVKLTLLWEKDFRELKTVGMWPSFKKSSGLSLLSEAPKRQFTNEVKFPLFPSETGIVIISTLICSSYGLSTHWPSKYLRWAIRLGVFHLHHNFRSEAVSSTMPINIVEMMDLFPLESPTPTQKLYIANAEWRFESAVALTLPSQVR